MSDDDDVKPMVSVREDGYYVGMWFVSGPGRDWMGVVHRDETGTFIMDSRFRYYADPHEKHGFDPFDADDVKNGLSAAFPGKTEEEAIAAVDGVVATLVSTGWCGTRLPWLVKKRKHRLLVRGNGKEFAKAVMAAPFTHQRADR